MSNIDPKQLIKILSTNYNSDELRSMCTDIDIDYEDLGGQGKSGKIRELVLYAQRRGNLDKIIAYVQKTRPDQVTDNNSSTDANANKNDKDATSTIVYNIAGDLIQGDKAGGDKVAGDKISGNKSGDIYNFSGNFQGAHVNVNSTLKDVNQTINTLPNADNAAKEELQQLLVQLNEALQQVPKDDAEDTDAVAQMTEALVETANNDKPNKMMLQITGDGLKKAAENIAAIVPSVTKIAGKIIGIILGLG